MVNATIVIDNHCQKQGLYAEWGFSVFIDTLSGNLLWDTGGILHVLEHNLRTLRIDPASVQNIAFSHGHFDHTAGLIDMLRMAPDAQLWAAPEIVRVRWGDADARRASGGGPLFASLPMHVVNAPTAILPEVTAFTVPQAYRDPRFVTATHMFESDKAGERVPDTFADDMSLLVKGDRGYSLILGCAHAGLPNILKFVKEELGVDALDTVTGGTHLSGAKPEDLPMWMETLKTSMPIRRWRVNHCTGFEATAMLSRYFDDVDWAGAGAKLTL